MKPFKTGHEIFDLISNLRTGSLVCVLDESYSESLDFLNALLLNLKEEMPVYVLAPYEVETPFPIIKIDITKSLNEINLQIASIREKIKKGVLIHRYLPYVLLRENENAFLVMMNHWSSKIADTGLVEFVLLPQGTFMPFEKKLQAITDGVIALKIEKREEDYQPMFSILRGSKPIYHFVEFPCFIKEGQLLIKWGDNFVVSAPEKQKENISATFLKNERKKWEQQQTLKNPYCV